MSNRALVNCDQQCGAYEDPETLEEFRATLLHWQEHSYMHGCSHGC